jgi:hypothetical protein
MQINHPKKEKATNQTGIGQVWGHPLSLDYTITHTPLWAVGGSIRSLMIRTYSVEFSHVRITFRHL